MLKKQLGYNRLTALSLFFLFIALIIIVRLFILQVIQHDYYALFALDTHEISKKLHPKRGEIYFQDSRNKQEYPAAVNRNYYLVFASPKEMSPLDTVSTTNRLADILGIIDPIEKNTLLTKLSQYNSLYVPLVKKASTDVVNKIKEAGIGGIHFTSQPYRFYPEESLAGPVLGFVGSDENGVMVGRYGLEGYFEQKIVGKGGFVQGERGALGSWITLAKKTLIEPENGPEIKLAIDRTLEFKACERLRQGMVDYKAKSGALVLMNPKTGAVLAMCSLPDFDPNNYGQTKDISAFNNTTIFTAYEPGSVFKPITMAAGLDAGLVNPNTTYVDPCKLIINGHPIHNAQKKCYGKQTMTQVLENSINTGVVWVEEKLGNERFKKYVEAFGFGKKSGIELNTEVAGDVSALGRKGQIFGASGSYGQGLTVTPLQLAIAYSAIANDGNLLKPYVVEEVRYPNGKIDRANTQTTDRVISSRAAKLLGGMLTSVVENHYFSAKIPNYYVAGKTGTAQIPEPGGYSRTRTNQTFAGFAPATDPKFVLVVKYEEPERQWAEETALPVFRDVMKFALDYYAVPRER